MSALALFYMAVTPLLTKRYFVTGCYYTWLIVVIDLIIPFRPQFSNAIVKVDIPSYTVVPNIQIENETPVTAPLENVLPSALPTISLWQIAAVVWSTGMIVFLVYHVIKHYRFLKLVARWSKSITDEQTLTLMKSLKSQMGLSKNIGLQFCDSIGSPMMIGFARPRILLPKADFAKDELCFILKHELVHYKRKDLWYKCLVLIATAIHWFNPIVYLMAKAIDIECELSCDEKVVHGTSADIRLYYSETIIDVVKYQSKLKTALSTNFYGGKKGMKKRIYSIMDMSKKKVGIALVCCMILVTTGISFVFAANAKPNKSPVNMIKANIPTPIQQQEKTDKQTEQDIKNQYAIYEQYGLTYKANEDKLYYKDQIVRYFIDRYNNGQGVLCVWAYDFDGTIDLYTVRNSVGLQGELMGIEAYSQEDFNLRSKEIEAEQNNIPDYDVMTFRFNKDNAPDALKLWIRQCENDVFDFSATQQNGRYYIYVRSDMEFGFSIKVDGDEANMQISRIDGVKGNGYALFSVPLYKEFTVTYNGVTKSFLQ